MSNRAPLRTFPPAAAHVAEMRAKLNVAHHGIGALLERWDDLTARQVYHRLCLLFDETRHGRLMDRAPIAAAKVKNNRAEAQRQAVNIVGAEAAAIRAWATECGLLTTKRGRLPTAVIEAYRAQEVQA